MLLFFGIAAPLMARASDGMDAAVTADFYDFFFLLPLRALTGH